MMALAAFLSKRWQLMVALMAMLAIMGINATIEITKSEDPIIRFPFANTVVVVPGANAAQMEQTVTIPIEKAIRRIEDVKEIYSESFDGVANIGVEFKWGVDSQAKFDEVVREINAIRASLPPTVQAIEFIRADSSLANVAQLAIVAPGTEVRRIESLAVDLRDAIERLPGVQRAEIWGIPPSEVHVVPDFNRLAAARLSPSDIVSAIRSQGLSTAIGTAESTDRRFNVQQSGRFKSLEDVRDIALTRVGDSVVKLGGVADVRWSNAETRHITRLNRQPVAFVSVKAELNADIFAVKSRVAQTVEGFKSRLPASAHIVVPFDQSRNVTERLGQLARDMMLAIVIVLLTLLPLGFRASLIVMASIPFSLMLGMLALHHTGFSLNQLSIAGFVLALGLIVDDSIVVIEIIVRRINAGMEPVAAAIQGMGEINAAVIGCTATVVLAFLPLLFLPDSAGGFLRSLPAAVLATVIASLIASLTVIPFLAGKLLRPNTGTDGNRILVVTLAAIHRFYAPLLSLAMRFPRRTIIIALGAVGLSFLLVPKLGFSLFPESDTPQIMIEVESQQGAGLRETDRAVAFAEKVLAARNDLDWVMANVGRGNPQVYYNFAPQRLRTTTGALFVSFREWDPKRSPQALEEIQAALLAYPGARFTVRRFVHGPPIDAPIVVRVIGKDFETLDALAARAVSVLSSTPGVRDIDNRQAIRQIDFDPQPDAERAGLLGVKPGAIDQLLTVALSGQTAATYYDLSGQAFPIVVRSSSDDFFPATALAGLRVWTATGQAVPLSSLVKMKLSSVPSQITRYQQERVIVIRAYAKTGYLPVDLARSVEARLRMIPVPAGYSYQMGGQAKAATSSFGGLAPVLIVTLFGIAIILLVEFGGFGQALVVAFVIPFGVAGGILALWIFGESLSFTAAIGLVTLIGIEIKNSILLVDLANKLRTVDGLSLQEAVLRAGEERFLPVLLTSMTAIGGLIPLIIDHSGLYSPLAIVIAGGLVSSTLIARIITPVAYLLLEQPGEMRSRRVASTQA
jgi:multidrug efflux pump subunit AcrB